LATLTNSPTSWRSSLAPTRTSWTISVAPTPTSCRTSVAPSAASRRMSVAPAAAPTATCFVALRPWRAATVTAFRVFFQFASAAVPSSLCCKPRPCLACSVLSAILLRAFCHPPATSLRLGTFSHAAPTTSPILAATSAPTPFAAAAPAGSGGTKGAVTGGGSSSLSEAQGSGSSYSSGKASPWAINSCGACDEGAKRRSTYFSLM